MTVPALQGSLGDAVAALRSAGLTLGEVTRADSPEPTDRVLGQSPAAGVATPVGSTVTLLLTAPASPSESETPSAIAP